MNISDQILESKKNEVLKLKQRYSLSSFSEMKFFSNQKLNFSKALNKSEELAVIAEIKKASPSKGILIEEFDHEKIASIYFEEKVDAVSVLTDQIFFKGSLRFLSDIAAFKQAPLLRKDFIIDVHQVFESKAFGADIILLICEALSRDQIDELSHAALECDLDVLVEMHSEDQIAKVNFDINKIIGINNRNLDDFSIDLSTTVHLSKLLPDDITIISESGIKSEQDVKYLKQTRANAILIGEYLMKGNNIKSALNVLKNWCKYES